MRFPVFPRLSLRDSSLRRRLGLGMAVVIFPLLLIAASGYLLFQFAIDALEESHEEIKAEMLPVLRLQELILQAQMPGNDYLLNGKRGEIADFDRLEVEIEDAFAVALEAPFDRMEKYQVLLQARDWWREGRDMSRQIFSLQNPLWNTEGIALMKQMDAKLKSASDHLHAVSAMSLTELDEQHATIHAWHKRVGVSIAVFLSILTAFVYLGSLLVRKWIISPLGELELAARNFSAGQLDYRIPVRSKDEIGVLAQTFNSMAASLQHDQEILHNLSIHDALTGLINRREFQNIIELEIARSLRHGRSLAVLMLDVDHFKRVNDNHGHHAGDEVLRELARRVSSTLRPNDVPARYGGEEFIVLLPETDAAGAAAMAERLCEQVRATPFPIGRDELGVTVSAGIAVYPQDAADLDTLQSMADKALYASKNAGRDRYTLYADIASVLQSGA